MVISHKHEYLWVELPRTSSTTISKALCTHYAGGKILSKHATYEDLQASFSEVLKLIGLEQKQPLPIRNLTRGKEKHFASYYTPEIIPRAKWVFGPFIREWGYEFPAEWGNEPVPLSSRVLYHCCNVFRSIYWRHLRLRVPPFR